MSETWKKTDPKGQHVCEECFKVKECAFIADPYDLDVLNSEIEKWLCEKCYIGLIMEI